MNIAIKIASDLCSSDAYTIGQSFYNPSGELQPVNREQFDQISSVTGDIQRMNQH